MADPYLTREPPTGSVVAIDWNGGETGHQEIWVSNSANAGCWYTPDLPLNGSVHPRWEDILRRAEGRTLTILVKADEDTYRIGWIAGAQATADAVTEAAEVARDGWRGAHG